MNYVSAIWDEHEREWIIKSKLEILTRDAIPVVFTRLVAWFLSRSLIASADYLIIDLDEWRLQGTELGAFPVAVAVYAFKIRISWLETVRGASFDNSFRRRHAVLWRSLSCLRASIKWTILIKEYLIETETQTYQRCNTIDKTMP